MPFFTTHTFKNISVINQYQIRLLSLNFYLTLVGGFLSLVAGIIAFFAKRSGGRSYTSPAYEQQDFNQQEQFYQEQTQNYQQQQYQQPEPYQQW